MSNLKKYIPKPILKNYIFSSTTTHDRVTVCVTTGYKKTQQLDDKGKPSNANVKYTTSSFCVNWIDDISLRENLVLVNNAINFLKSHKFDTVNFIVHGQLKIPSNVSCTDPELLNEGVKCTHKNKNHALCVDCDNKIYRTIICAVRDFEELYRVNIRNVISPKTVYIPKTSGSGQKGWVTVTNRGNEYKKKEKHIYQTINS
jgi:hypothetical protein